MFTEPQAIVKLKAAIAEILPDAEVSVDQPTFAYGGWVVDIKQPSFHVVTEVKQERTHVVVEYLPMREDNKFGVSLLADKPFGEGHDEVRAKIPDVVSLVVSMLEGRYQPKQV